MNPSKALYFVAGVDYETIAKCPKTDRLWAAHLGFSLILSLLVVGAITYHATSYVVTNSPMRFAVSVVVALTVFMFDRALYQADWFLQAPLENSEWSATRLIRITFRLAISICLSFALAMFLELAIFSDTITEQLQNDSRRVNSPLLQKAQDFEIALDEEIVQRKEALAAAEDILLAIDRGERQTGAPLHELQATLRNVNQDLARVIEDRNAELFGQKTRPGQTGVRGPGPAYQFAEAQVRSLKEQQQEINDTIDGLHSETAAARVNVERQVSRFRAEIRQLLGTKAEKAATFRQLSVEGSPEFQKQKNDPLARMAAYAELKRDPVEGQSIVLLSWLVRLFVSFLEVVPVAAKMFFCPPSVYGSMIQAEVLRERRRAERLVDLEDAGGLKAAASSEADSNPAQYRRIADVLAKRERPVRGINTKKRELGEDPAPVAG